MNQEKLKIIEEYERKQKVKYIRLATAIIGVMLLQFVTGDSRIVIADLIAVGIVWFLFSGVIGIIRFILK